MAFEPGQFLPRGQIPHFDQLVTARRHELLPIPAQIHVEDRVLVRPPRGNDSVIGDAAQAQEAALRLDAIGHQERVAVRQKLDRRDAARQPIGPLTLRLERFPVPKRQAPESTRDQPSSIAAPGERLNRIAMCLELRQYWKIRRISIMNYQRSAASDSQLP